MARITVALGRIKTPLHTPFVTALRRTTTVRSVVVRLTDDTGECGYGEAPEVWRITGESMETVEACVSGPLGEVLSAWDLESPLEELAAALRDAVVGNTGAKAACEVAATDLLARRAGIPLHRYLGAVVPTVATDLTVAADANPDLTSDALREGFRRLKVKVGVDKGDVRRVLEINDRAEEPVLIRIDANQGWDLQTASDALDAWVRAGLNVEFVEQPLPRWDLAGHAELRRRVPVPVMLDESIFGARDLERAVDLRSCDLVNVKLAKSGLQGGRALVDAAGRAGIGVMVGSMLESEAGVGAAAALAAAVAPDMVHDLDAAWWSIPRGATVSPYAGGRFQLGDGPGLRSHTDRMSVVDWHQCR